MYLTAATIDEDRDRGDRSDEVERESARNLSNTSLSPFDNVTVPRVTCRTLLRIRGGLVGVNGEVARLIRSTSNIRELALDKHVRRTSDVDHHGNTSRLRFGNSYISTDKQPAVRRAAGHPEERQESTHS